MKLQEIIKDERCIYFDEEPEIFVIGTNDKEFVDEILKSFEYVVYSDSNAHDDESVEYIVEIQ